MSSKNFFILACAVLLLVSTASAQEDFSAVSQKSVLVTCEGSTTSDVITVKNTGFLTSEYAVSFKGGAAAWATAAPTGFALKPGETVNIFSYLTPPLGSRGDYILETQIKTNLGLTKTLSQKLSVNNCINLVLTPIVSSQTTCQCTTATYRFNIKNLGSYTESYSMALDQAALFSKNPLVLSPGASEDVSVQVNMPCNFLGKKEMNLEVVAQKSGFTASTVLALDTVLCYDFGIGAADAYEICGKSTIPVNIVNKGGANSYEIKFSGPDWVRLSTNKLELRSREVGSINLNLEPGPDTIGLFDITLDVTALNGGVSKKKSIAIKKQVCYTPAISVKKIAVNHSETTTRIKLKNTGPRQATYSLSVEGPPWIAIKPTTLSLGPGEEKFLELRTTPKEDVKKGDYDAKINIIVQETNNIYPKKITIRLTEFKKIPTSAYLFVFTLMLTIMLIIAIVVFLSKRPVVKRAEVKPEKVVKVVETKIEKPKIIKTKVAKPKITKPGKKKADLKKTLKGLRPIHYFIIALILLALVLGWLYLTKPDYFSKIIQASKLIEIKKPAPPVKPPEVTPIKMPSLEAVKAFLKSYVYYIIAGIAVLIAFIILISRSKKQRVKKGVRRITESEVKEVIKPERIKPREGIKAKKPGKWPWYAIGIIIIAALAYLVYHYYQAIFKLISSVTVRHKFLSDILEAITLYRNHPLIGIALLIVVLIILNFARKPGEEKPEKTTFVHYLSWLIGLAVVIAVVYYVFKLLIIPFWIYILLGICGLIIVLILIALLKKIKTKKEEIMVWEETLPNRDNFMTPRNRKLAFGELILTTKKKLHNVKISVAKLRRKPTFMKASGRVYEYYKVDKENLENADISKAVMRFRVKKSWINKNRLDESQITLKRYTNRWINVRTNRIDSDNNHVYYEAEVDRLSYFAIVGIKERAERPKKWPYAVLLVLLIIAGAYLFLSTSQEPAPITETEPIITKTFTTQVWDEDSELTIDLSDYFYDPDRDILRFTSTKPENIDVEITDSTAVLTPKPDWNGQSYIVFTADDGKGGITSSDRVTLIVKEVPEQMLLGQIKGFFSGAYSSIKNISISYLNYIIYGVVALVVVLLIIKYNKQIIGFFLEEEENNKKGR